MAIKTKRKPKRKVKKKMSRNRSAVIAFLMLLTISGVIVVNAFAQDNGLGEACGIMGGSVYSNDIGNRICVKD